MRSLSDLNASCLVVAYSLISSLWVTLTLIPLSYRQKLHFISNFYGPRYRKTSNLIFEILENHFRIILSLYRCYLNPNFFFQTLVTGIHTPKNLRKPGPHSASTNKTKKNIAPTRTDRRASQAVRGSLISSTYVYMGIWTFELTGLTGRDVGQVRTVFELLHTTNIPLKVGYLASDGGDISGNPRLWSSENLWWTWGTIKLAFSAPPPFPQPCFSFHNYFHASFMIKHESHTS